MAEGKKSFVAYVDWKETFDALPDDKAGKLVKHLFAYINDENPVSEDVLINVVFINIKQQLKRDLDKYEQIRERNKENGLKGGRPQRNPKKPKKPTGLSGLSEKPKKPDTDTVTDTDIGIDINNKERFIIPPTLEMVKKYCEQRNNKIDPQYFIDTNTMKGWVYGKSNIKIKDWQACIRTWEKYSKPETKPMMP